MVQSRSIMSVRLAKYFGDYSSFHKTKGNQKCHSVGLPLITVSLLGMLGSVAVPEWGFGDGAFIRADLGIALLVVALGFYTFLDWKLALPFGFVGLGGYFLGRAIPMPANGVLFVVGWIFQGLGHRVYEKNSPAFFRNFLHLLIGPFWLFAKAVGYR